MSVTNPSPQARASLIARVQNIILKPKAEWPVIEAEQTTIAGLYTGYIAILAAIPVVAEFIGSLVFGYSFLGITYHPSFGGALSSAIVRYVLTLVGVFILAVIIELLAPTFDSRKDRLQAFKLAAYTATAGWLAGVFAIFPTLSFLSLLGLLYSFYLLYLGLPVMMKTPQGKVLPYMATIIVIGVVLGLVLGVIATTLVPRRASMAESGGGKVTGQLKLPNGATVDVGALSQAAKNLEDAANQAAGAAGSQSTGSSDSGTSATPSAGAPTMIDPAKLKSLLPDSLPGGFRKGEVSSASGGAAGLGTSSAKADYANGESHMTVTVTDMGALGAMAGLAAVAGAQGSEKTPTHYSKMSTIDGRPTFEEYDRTAKSGTYSVIVANRLMVEVEGSSVDMKAMKSAMGRIDLEGAKKLIK